MQEQARGVGSGEVLAETEMRHKQLELADGGSESSSFCPTVRDDALIEVQIELLQCAAFYPALVAFKPRNITLLWLEKKTRGSWAWQAQIQARFHQRDLMQFVSLPGGDGTGTRTGAATAIAYGICQI